MNRNLVIASVVGVVFLFAGYNLYAYFKEQQAIQAAEDLRAEQRRAERDAERARMTAELDAQRLEKEQAKEQARISEEERRVKEAEERKAARLNAEADAAQRRTEKEAEQAKESAERLAERIKKARTLTHVPEIRSDVLLELSKLSPRYVQDKPEEFLGAKFDPDNLGSSSERRFMVHEGTDALMMFAVIDQDRSVLKALIDIGMDVNAKNERGFTPLMFAAAYAYPETVQYLIEQGADIDAKAYIMDVNALHLAALRNPDPGMIDVLLDAGLSVESPVQNGYTPILLAASDNRNLEVVERLVERGADVSVYDDNGRTVKAVVQGRIDGEGDVYVKISDEVNQRVLKKFTID